MRHRKVIASQLRICLQCQRPGFDPWVGNREGNGNPLQCCWLENPMDRGAWQATVHRVTRIRHNLASKPPPLRRQKQGNEKCSLRPPPLDYEKIIDTGNFVNGCHWKKLWLHRSCVLAGTQVSLGGNSQMFSCEKVHQGQRRSKKLIFEDNFLMNFQLRLSFRGPGLLGDLESSWKGSNGVQLWTQRKHLLRITLTGWTPALPGFLWALWVPVVCCIDLAFSGFIAILNMWGYIFALWCSLW